MDAEVTREVVLQAPVGGLVTDRVEVRRITLPPDTAAGAHFHNGPVVGCVLTGTVLFGVEGSETVTLNPGDVFHEPAEVTISHFDAGPDGAVFLGYFLLEAGQEASLTPIL